jgi:hypothetical protein
MSTGYKTGNDTDLINIFKSGTSPGIVTDYKTIINDVIKDLAEIFAPYTSGQLAANTNYVTTINNTSRDLSEIFQVNDPFTFNTGSSTNYIASTINYDNVTYNIYYFNTGTFSFYTNYSINIYQIWSVANGAPGGFQGPGGAGGQVTVLGDNTTPTIYTTISSNTTFNLNVNNYNTDNSYGQITNNTLNITYTALTGRGAGGGGGTGGSGSQNLYTRIFYGGGGGGTGSGNTGSNGGIGGGGGGGGTQVSSGTQPTGGNGGGNGISSGGAGGRQTGRGTRGFDSSFGGGGGTQNGAGGNGGPGGGSGGASNGISGGGGGGGGGLGGGGGAGGRSGGFPGGGGSGITILIFRNNF